MASCRMYGEQHQQDEYLDHPGHRSENNRIVGADRRKDGGGNDTAVISEQANLPSAETSAYKK